MNYYANIEIWQDAILKEFAERIQNAITRNEMTLE